MRTETFSYLPPLTEKQVEKQVSYILKNGWIPGIEFSRELNPYDSFWSYWKLPFFTAEKTGEVMQELDACRQAHPDAYIRLTGYDNIKQGQVLSFVAYRPQ